MLAAIRKNSQHFTRNIIMANPSRRKKIGICRKIVLTVCLHLVAFGAVVGYCVIGAQIFMSIESYYEQAHCVSMNANRDGILDKVFKNVIANENEPRQFQKDTSTLMEEYEHTLLKMKTRGYRHGSFYDDCVEWNFAGSFFYSLSVITTFGNGQIVPDTHEGRLVTIIYALIGIPLFILYLGFTGSSLARSFQGIFLKASSCCRKEDDDQRELSAMSRLKKRTDVDGAETLKASEAEVSTAGVSFSNVDDFESGNREPQVLADIDVEHRPYWCPILFALLMLVAHTVAGTLLIAHWQSWTFFDSFYLIFLILSTIGFGDFLPIDASMRTGAFLPLYFLTGYTIWAAVYILIYEVAQQKFREFGRRLGIK